METNPENFPYPFYSSQNDHYIDVHFEADLLDVKLDKNTSFFEIDVEVILDNTEINRMIKQGDLALLIHVECPLTYYDKIFYVTDNVTRIYVEKEKVAQKIEINVTIVAKRTIKKYANKNFNEFFQNYSFTLYLGNIIGAAYAGDIFIENQSPEKIESIFSLHKNKNMKPGEINADYIANKIAIYLSDEDHLKVDTLLKDKTLQSTIYSLIVIPVLINTVHYINENYTEENSQELENLDWFKSIREKLNEIDIDLIPGEKLSDELIIATKLIDKPLIGSLNYLLEGDKDE